MKMMVMADGHAQCVKKKNAHLQSFFCFCSPWWMKSIQVWGVGWFLCNERSFFTFSYFPISFWPMMYQRDFA
jgi:hypothetical protein